MTRRGVGARSRRTLALIAIAAFAVMLSGCPFSSDQPLADPRAAAAEPALAGTWRMQDPESGEWNVLTIFAFDEHEMVGFAPEKDSDKVSAFRLFVTEVGAERFLNVQELGASDTSWFFARFTVAGDRMLLTVVDDELFSKRSFATSADLREFIRAHLGDPLLYAAAGDTPMESAWERGAPKP
jgi:hypothetical protein